MTGLLERLNEEVEVQYFKIPEDPEHQQLPLPSLTCFDDSSAGFCRDDELTILYGSREAVKGIKDIALSLVNAAELAAKPQLTKRDAVVVWVRFVVSRVLAKELPTVKVQPFLWEEFKPGLLWILHPPNSPLLITHFGLCIETFSLRRSMRSAVSSVSLRPATWRIVTRESSAGPSGC